MNIPEGFRLVPVDPTEEMLDVEINPVLCLGNPATPRVEQWRRGLYAAMLDAAPAPPISSPVSWQYRHKFEEDGEIEIGLWQHCEEKIYDLLQSRKSTETRQLYTVSAVCAPTPPKPIYDESKERELFEAWADDKGFRLDCDLFKKGNNYEDRATAWIYEAWQARAKSVEVGDE